MKKGRFSLTVGMLVLCASVSLAQTLPGYKKKGDTSWTRVDSIAYSSAKDEYQIRGAGGVGSYPLDRKLVVDLDIPKPQNYDPYRIEASKPSSVTPAAVAGLEDIRKIYSMLKWDVEALKLLVPIYDYKRQYNKVIEECNYIRKWNERVPEELQDEFWTALSKDKASIPDLKKALKEAIETGSRQLSATAHLVRGDILTDEAKYQEALVEGYFRVILLFKDVPPDIQAKAHFKAWEVLQKTRDARAEKIKRKLLDEFPGSEYAQRLGAAGSK